MKKRIMIAAAAVAVMGLTGCGGGGGATTAAVGATASSTGGSASKGPLNCTAQGSVIATGSGGAFARGSTPNVGSFTVNTTGLAYPITVTMSGCLDTVTGVTQDFDLSTMMMDATQIVTNATPISTLAVAAAKANAGAAQPTQAQLDAAVSTVLNTFGLSASLSNPMTGSFNTTADITSLVMASEAVSEVIKRTAIASQGTGTPVNAATALANLATDLKSGGLTGANKKAVGLLIATVLNEVAGRTLVINQVDATGAPVATKTSAAIQASIAAVATAVTGGTVTSATVATAIANTAVTKGAAGAATAIANAANNGTSITSAGQGASSFKLSTNTATVQDYNAVGAALTLSTTPAATTTAAGVMTVTMATAFTFNALNASNVVGGTGKVPVISFNLANVPAGTGVATITAKLKRAVGSSAVSVPVTVNWSSNGTNLTLTAAAGTTNAAYVDSLGNQATAILINQSANVISVSANVTTGVNTLNVAISKLFNANTAIGTALSGAAVAGNYAYNVTISGIPLLDATGVAVSTIKGVFTIQ